MSAYVHERRHASRLAALLRFMAVLLRSGWFVLFLMVLASPVGPHVIVRYEHAPRGSGPTVWHCDYVGSRGLVRTSRTDACFPVAIFDRRHVGWRFIWPDHT